MRNSTYKVLRLHPAASSTVLAARLASFRQSRVLGFVRPIVISMTLEA